MDEKQILNKEKIREMARIEAREEREKELKEKMKERLNNDFVRNMIIGVLALIFMYFVLYKPLRDMFS